ncbi:MAG: peptidylprolyl isomerase [Oscillospiraceae bacterium]
MKLKNALISIGLAVTCLVTSGCKGKTLPGNIGNEVTFKDGDLIAEIIIEDYGTIKAKLFPEIAPNAVDNFVKLADNGYYDGLKIHRVAKDMCIQGGSLNGDGTGGTALINTDGVFANEISLDARHFYGALCSANQFGKNTTQFYIVNCKTPQDITQYDSAKILEKAAEFTSAKENTDSFDPDYDYIVAQEAYYTELANMLSKASEEVVTKYAEKGGYPLWDGMSTVFGQMYEGFDVLEKITAVEVTTNSLGKVERPKSDIIISSVKVTKYVTPEPVEEETSSSSKKKKK